MSKQICKQHFPITLFRQPIFTSKTYNHAATYNHTSADGNLRPSRVLSVRVSALNVRVNIMLW